jgi:hypothetical protein
MLAVSDDGVRQMFHANGAFLLALDDELKRLLQERTVLVIERDDVLLFEELHQVGDTLFA